MAKQETEKTKGKTSSKRLSEEGSKDNHFSQKKARVLESTGQLTSLGSLPVNLPDSVCLILYLVLKLTILKIPQINLIPNTPTRSDQGMVSFKASIYLAI